MNIKNILEITNGKLICGDETTIITTFSKDTRTIQENDTYIGIKGANFDGNNFYLDAFNKGANIAILDNEQCITKYEKNIILVENSIKALHQIAAYKRSLLNIPVIAITGSVGKTSTKDIISKVLKEKYRVYKTPENYNNGIGLPLTILNYKDEDVMVLEMGMNSLGEISLLSNIAKPTIALITNVGTAHIGKLGSRENILKAKLEIIDGMNKNATLIINNDNDLLNQINFLKIKNILRFSIYNNSDIQATNIIREYNKSIFKISDTNYEINIPGDPFIYNALSAYTVAKLLELSNKEIQTGLKNIILTKNRLETTITKNNITIINDAYNANLDSMKYAIDYLSNQPGKRKIAVLGDILELGKYSKEIHNEIGTYLQNKNIDIIICYGNEAKYIWESAINNLLNKKNIILINNKKELLDYLYNILKDNDTILLKASNGMNLISIANNLIDSYK